jgi:hypothetical protein
MQTLLQQFNYQSDGLTAKEIKHPEEAIDYLMGLCYVVAFEKEG